MSCSIRYTLTTLPAYHSVLVCPQNAQACFMRAGCMMRAVMLGSRLIDCCSLLPGSRDACERTCSPVTFLKEAGSLYDE